MKIALAFLSILLAQSAAAVAIAADLDVSKSGAVVVPSFTLPPSQLASPEMSASRVDHIFTKRSLAGKPIDELNAVLFGHWLKPSEDRYPVKIESATIAGVPVLVYTPKNGISAEDRDLLLINLHGGGFTGCFRECGGLESIPTASLSGIKVISVDYREGPKGKFPEASEDVASVYTEILKTHRAEQVGIFGCSAGGMLTGQSLAWFQAHHLPAPAAVGIFCAGGNNMAGDSSFLGPVIGDGVSPPGETPRGSRPPMGYFAGTNANDPLISPAASAQVLSAFPPTLIISGTRDFALSSALYLHEQLVKVGVQTDLHVWEGGRHAFFYDPSVPEGHDAFTVISKFFHRHLHA